MIDHISKRVRLKIICLENNSTKEKKKKEKTMYCEK